MIPEPIPNQPTDVARAWGIRAGMRIWVGGHNVRARSHMERCLQGTVRSPTGTIDRAFLTPKSNDEAAYFAVKLSGRLHAAGVLWIVVPTEGSRCRSEFIGQPEEFRIGLHRHGYTEVATVSLDQDYHSFGFRFAGATGVAADSQGS